MNPQRLKDRIEALGWTAPALAKQLNCDRAVVRRWMNGTPPAGVPPAAAEWIARLAVAAMMLPAHRRPCGTPASRGRHTPRAPPPYIDLGLRAGRPIPPQPPGLTTPVRRLGEVRRLSDASAALPVSGRDGPAGGR